MVSPVTLILGNSAIAEHTAIEAKAQGHKVVLGLAGTSTLSSDHTPLNADDHDSFVSLFQQTVDKYGGFDYLVLAFTHDEKKGLEDDVLGPLTRAVKNGWYHWRRDSRSFNGKDPRKLVILAEQGDDIGTKTTYHAVIGFYRSISVRTENIGPRIDLVLSNVSDERNTDSTVKALLLKPTGEAEWDIKNPNAPGRSSVHIVSEGTTKSQSYATGQCFTVSIRTLTARFLRLLKMDESGKILGHRVDRWFNPPKSASALVKLRVTALWFFPTLGFITLAALAWRSERPFWAFAMSLIATRLSPQMGTGLLAVAGWETITGRKLLQF